jgi:HlyD family secretion protein
VTVNRRGLIYGGAGLLVLVLTIVSFRPRPVAVEVAPLKRGPMSVAVQDRGQTRVLDRYVISSPVAGNIERIPFQAGDAVRQGEVVARIKPSTLSVVGGRQAEAAAQQAEAAVREADANLRRAESRANLAAKARQRQAALRASGIASQEALDTARADEEAARRDVEAARATVAQATAGVASARAALLALNQGGAGTVEIRAPLDSRIFGIPERSGRALLPGDPIMTLGNPHEIEAVIDLLSEDAVKTTAGDRAFLVDWGGPRPLDGSVKSVESSAFTKVSALGIEEQRVHVIVSIPNPPPALGDGYRVQGRIVVWSAANALQLPVGALTRFGERWGAFVVDGGRARSRTLEIGHRNDEAAEVLSGLRPDERVILHPSDSVADGVRVKAE